MACCGGFQHIGGCLTCGHRGYGSRRGWGFDPYSGYTRSRGCRRCQYRDPYYYRSPIVY